jgi:hypothetical protein
LKLTFQFPLHFAQSPLPFFATMSAVNRGLRTASKQLRVSRLSPASLSVGRSASVGAATRVFATPSSTSRSNFSTSVTRLSGAPVMASQPREYDPEIKDIADYVANKPIDSDLAVSFARRWCSASPPIPAAGRYPAAKFTAREGKKKKGVGSPNLVEIRRARGTRQWLRCSCSFGRNHLPSPCPQTLTRRA